MGRAVPHVSLVTRVQFKDPYKSGERTESTKLPSDFHRHATAHPLTIIISNIAIVVLVMITTVTTAIQNVWEAKKMHFLVQITIHD